MKEHIIRTSAHLHILTSSLIFFSHLVVAQDTVRYMHYNLLYYTYPYVVCDETNNNLTMKDQYLRTILEYVNPDILAVNEIGSNTYSVQRLLDSAVNAYSGRVYSRAAITNYAGSQIVNMIYWDPLKLSLHSQDVVLTDVRDINLYKFYFNTKGLAQNHDTAWVTAVTAHLKAGSSQDDEIRRGTMALTLMNYLNAVNEPGNYILSGDMNLYRSSEQAYQHFTNYSNALFRFHDPTGQAGDWTSNPQYSGIHTQSTHSSSNGCASSGGMDDRFDFIFVSNDLANGNSGVKALSNTYRAVGQDGNHFNLSLTAPPQNYSVPQAVLDALYGMSDHLPVIMDLRTDQALSVHELFNPATAITVQNPVKDEIRLFVPDFIAAMHLQLFSPDGRQIWQREMKTCSGMVSLRVTQLNPGFYLLKITLQDGYSVTRKLNVY